ncbi:MAG: hypothetical protein K6U74_13020 [Firmicutes bacterium]|nr:hypothetical protein [Bacillota bacterium]
MAEAISQTDSEHERVIRALFEESKDVEEFAEKVMSRIWSRNEKLRRVWPDEERYLKDCLPRFLEVAERETPPEDRDIDYVFFGR